jgi:serine/threonine-protein kinase
MTALRDRLQHALGATFTLDRELGGGGMSRVFVATETALGRAVVIKVVAPELLEGISADRFTREVKLAARLQQANIVPLLSAGDASGVPYYTMPFVDGLSLRARIANGTAISLGEATHILRDVAKALAYAHAQGVVHRDIKPENVLLSGGTAMVTDFGIAKAVAAAKRGGRPEDGSPKDLLAIGLTPVATLTSAGSSLGTPAYMAPEQAVGSTVDSRTDLYAWGAMAYELLTGAHVFAGKTTAQALIAAHIAETPVPIATKNASIPASLAAVVMRCLEKDPARRPASAAELLAALDSASTPDAAAAPHVVAGSRRTRWLLAGASVAVVVLAVSAWMISHKGQSASAVGEAATAEKSLAVLPFESVGGDTANAYFAEGIADELTTALAKVNGLRVAATSSAFSYRNKAADPREVGKALNVGAVLQGRVRREGSRMRVSAQLTNASDGLVVWSNSYEREVKDVFAVQDELAREIVGALRLALARGATTTNTPGTRDVVAHDLYLRGLYFLNQRGPGVARSIPYFQQAIARDSMFARAWAQIGTAHGFLPIFDYLQRDTTFREARAAIDRALRIDSLTAEAHAANGLIAAMTSQWSAANAAYQRAIALDSNYSVTYRLALSTLAMLAREADAQAASRALMERDPLSPVTATVIALTQLSFGRRDEALVSARRAVELDSIGAMPRAMLATAELANGHPDIAVKFAKTAGHTPNTTPWIAWVYGAAGERQAAADLLNEVGAKRDRHASAELTAAFAALGARDTTRALDALERAARAREAIGFMAPFGLPAYDPIRGSARFAAIVRAFGADPASFARPMGAAR